MDTQEIIMFELDKEQVRQIIDWKKTHNCSIGYIGAIGGKYTYSFIPTSMGMVSIIKCACGSEINLTDYNDW